MGGTKTGGTGIDRKRFGSIRFGAPGGGERPRGVTAGPKMGIYPSVKKTNAVFPFRCRKGNSKSPKSLREEMGIHRQEIWRGNLFDVSGTKGREASQHGRPLPAR